MSFLDELKASLEEAVEIKQGNKAAARVTRYEVADVKAIRAQLNISQAEMEEALAKTAVNPCPVRAEISGEKPRGL
ncbi:MULTISPECIES: NadS family protein [Photorhabdus]|uniref:Transcriptional regulator n=1 Tax=Photorhabdus hindustanensis TaxID=2918802 RepID=A0A2S8PZX3_9GAMM|nr:MULTISPECIES: NadS family protein [Photorhabdus]MBS9434636.1 hypothetical protein [Photorhabdus hainanensis]PQQ24953.1 hypothetical protein C6H66_13900 [Photorhabdus hindustanensis]